MTTILNAITLRLPWPASKLSPNSRGAWQTREASRKAARQIGEVSVYQAAEGDYIDLPDRLQMTVTFHPPDSRRRDLDGLHSRLKSYQDGIFAALRLDDSSIDRVVLERGKPLKGGMVTVILGEVEG